MQTSPHPMQTLYHSAMLVCISLIGILPLRFACMCFSDRNSSSNMKIDTLAFVNVMLSSHNPKVFHPHINVIVPVSTRQTLSFPYCTK